MKADLDGFKISSFLGTIKKLKPKGVKINIIKSIMGDEQFPIP